VIQNHIAIKHYIKEQTMPPFSTVQTQSRQYFGFHIGRWAAIYSVPVRKCTYSQFSLTVSRTVELTENMLNIKCVFHSFLKVLLNTSVSPISHELH
jgi:hypothetical protein